MVTCSLMDGRHYERNVRKGKKIFNNAKKLNGVGRGKLPQLDNECHFME